MQYELKTYFPTVDHYLKTVKNNNSGAYNAGFYWCYYFERPANTYSTSVYRGNRAKSIYWPQFGSASTYVSAAVAENGIKLTWNATGKEGYLVKRCTKKNGTYATIATIKSGTKKSYTDHGVVRGKKYYYYIVPLAKDGTNMERSNKVSCNVKPSIQDAECRVKLSGTEYVYSGKAKKPKVTVTYADERLVLNRDYTLLYNKNINAGTASVTIAGKGGYAGVLKKTFTIKKAKQTIKAAASVQTVQKNGSYALKVSASGKGKLKYVTSEPSVVAVKSGKLCPKGAGVAQITVKAAATANYTSASKVITMTVNPAKPAITGIADKGQGRVWLKWKASKS